MNFVTAIKTVFGKYATFRGVASRPEYWWWTLFSFIITNGLNQVADVLGGNSRHPSGASLAVYGISVLFALATLIPSLAVAVRRFHDAGFSGKWLLLSIIPVVALIAVLVTLFGSAIALMQPTAKSAEIGLLLFAMSPFVLGPMLLGLAVGVFFFIVTVLPSKSADAGNKYAS